MSATPTSPLTTEPTPEVSEDSSDGTRPDEMRSDEMRTDEMRTDETRPERGRWALTALVALGTLAALMQPETRTLALTLVVLLALISLHELGHLLAARASGVGASEFSVGFGPLLAGTRPRPGRTRYVLRAVPLGGYVRIKGLGETGAARHEPATPGKSYLDVSAPRQMFIAVAGPAANLLVALVVFITLFAVAGVPAATTAVTPQLDSPAASAGMLPGDQIVAIGAVPIESWDQVLDTVATAPPGPLPVTVQRGNAQIVLMVPDASTGPRLGVTSLATAQRQPLPNAVVQGAAFTWDTMAASATALMQLPAIIMDMPAQVLGSAEDPNARLVSPIGMAGLAADSAEESGLAGVLALVGIVSVFLALFNLLPIPPLDGGHIVIAGVEAVASRVARRPVTVSRVAIARFATVVVVLLLVLGVATVALDILRPIALS